MVKPFQILLLASAVCILTISGHAAAENQQSASQQTASDQEQASSTQSSGKNATGAQADQQGKAIAGSEAGHGVLAAQMPSQVLASSLIDMPIRNKAGQIGTVSDLILNKDLKLVGFVVDMSGATGLISKSVGISRNAMQNVDLKKGVIQVDVKKSDLQSVRSYATQKELNQ